MARARTAAEVAAGRARPYVVVGLDTSESARRALRWAEQYAAMAGGTVVGIVALPGFDPAPEDSAAAMEAMDAKLAAAERDALARVGALVAEEVGDPSRMVTAAVPGGVADVLLTASSDADLLVIGNTPKGGLGRALLGGSRLGRIAQADCPVVLVRST